MDPLRENTTSEVFRVLAMLWGRHMNAEGQRQGGSEGGAAAQRGRRRRTAPAHKPTHPPRRRTSAPLRAAHPMPAPPSRTPPPARRGVECKHLRQPLVAQAGHAAVGRRDPVDGRRLVRPPAPRALRRRHGERQARVGRAPLGARGARGARRACPLRCPCRHLHLCFCFGFPSHGTTPSSPPTWYRSMASSVRRTTAVMVSRAFKGKRPYAVSPAAAGRGRGVGFRGGRGLRFRGWRAGSAAGCLCGACACACNQGGPAWRRRGSGGVPAAVSQPCSAAHPTAWWRRRPRAPRWQCRTLPPWQASRGGPQGRGCFRRGRTCAEPA